MKDEKIDKEIAFLKKENLYRKIKTVTSIKRNKIFSFFQLMRADKPTGTALLLWPTLSSFFILTKSLFDLFIYLFLRLRRCQLQSN